MKHEDIVNLLASDVTVVSAVLKDVKEPDKVLLGVRQPLASSARHPGVLSTLTMRVPVALFASAIAEVYEGNELPSIGEKLRIESGARFPFGVANGFASTSVFLVESLLARKVAVADQLVNGTLRGDVSALGVTRDVVTDPKGGFEPEVTTMLTYLVTVQVGATSLPSHTSSYRPLTWVDSGKLQTAVARRNAHILVPDADPFEVCLHGMCVRSAAELLS